MDFTKDIVYRNLNLNNVFSPNGTRTLSGLSVESIDYSNVSAVGYTEKRAASDGMYASDVYLGVRQMILNGLIYATVVPELYDWLHLIRSTFSPTSAYQQSPGDQGFLALSYSQPTSDVASWDGVAPGEMRGQVNLQMFVRPLDGSPRYTLNRDRITRNGGVAPAALPYSVRLTAKDPRVYVSPQQVKDVSGAHPALTSGTAKNRGDYESPLDILLVVGSTAPSAPNNVFVVKGFGVDMAITLEAAKANRVYRWFGNDRVLMVQDSTGGLDAPFALRMDLVTFATKVTRPMVPAQINPPTKPFTSSYQYSCAYALGAGSRLFWYEAFA